MKELSKNLHPFECRLQPTLKDWITYQKGNSEFLSAPKMRSGAIVGQTTVHQKELVIVTDSDLV